MLAEHLTAESRPWAHDRGNTVGASEVGMCARQVWLRKNGVAPERIENWGFSERGHVVEAWVVRRLRSAGIRLSRKQHTLSRGFLSATVDAIYKNTCVDVKSFDPRKTEIVQPKHLLQVQVQIGLWNEVGRRRIKDGLLLYVNASDFQDVREHRVERNPDLYAAMHERARTIMSAASHQDLAPEGRIAGGKECSLCPFQTACLGAPIEDKGHLSDEDRAAIETARHEIKRTDADIAERERISAAAKERIRNVLRAADVRRAPGLARIARNSRSSVDHEAMKRDGIDVDRYRKPGRESETVTLE